MGIKSCESGVLKELTDSSGGGSSSTQLELLFKPGWSGHYYGQPYVETSTSVRHLVEDLDNPTASDESYITNVLIESVPEDGFLIFLGSTTHDLLSQTATYNTKNGTVSIGCVPASAVPGATNAYTPSITIIPAEQFWDIANCTNSGTTFMTVQISPNSQASVRRDGLHISKLFFPSYYNKDISAQSYAYYSKNSPFVILHLNV
ncbi:MAG: hypothetical protein J6Y02_24175 [Pseudobutyrivibrio sp.]|nr:hypothetical protein [Pseudobutyrivibrio sp.]